MQLAPSLRRSADAPQRAAVLTRAALAAADRLGLTARLLARVLGLSEPTISRMKRGDAVLEDGAKSWELAAHLVRIFRSLDAITGGDEGVARAWMGAENTALGGVPRDRIVTIQGLLDVAAYLDARRAPL